jgi:ammonium transporter Rh
MEQENRVQAYYPIFQDVHVMIYIGFGFLMVFLKKHCWTSVGFNFIVAAWSMQLAILITGFWHMALVEEEFHKITLDIPSLIIGDFGAAAVLITFGALLGKCDLPQLWVLATLEIIFYALNEGICAGILQAVDMGGSMYVHTFGAYFGLAASFHFKNKLAQKSPAADENAGGYLSQTIAMVGTLFLFMFWPSFNGALASENQQQRVIINTTLAITASTLAAAAICRIKFGMLEMEVILNATLAGGVAVGSASDLVVTAGIAMAIGCLAGIISALGFMYLGPWL